MISSSNPGASAEVPAVKISATMAAAIEKAREHGSLVRWPGGYWTYDGCDFREAWPDRERVPSWYVNAGTIFALIKRRTFEVIERSAPAQKHARRVRLVAPAGEA